MPEESGESTGLVVNDTPASSTMEGVEEVEVVEAAGDGEMGEASEAKEEPSKKRGPSNMVSGWGKGAKKVAGKPGRVETPKRKALRAAVSATIENIRLSSFENYNKNSILVFQELAQVANI